MTKQQQYFEKNVIPYRQKIRELESESSQLHRDKAILRIRVEQLECENDMLFREIKSIMEFADMKPDDRKIALERYKALDNVSGLFKAFSKCYIN